MSENDLSCLDDLDADGAELNDPIDILDQDLWHRLLEEYGSNPDDKDRGCGLLGRLSGAFDSNFGREIEADFRKDPRVSAVTCVLTQTAPGVVRIDIVVEADGQELAITAEYTPKGGVRRVVR